MLIESVQTVKILTELMILYLPIFKKKSRLRRAIEGTSRARRAPANALSCLGNTVQAALEINRKLSKIFHQTTSALLENQPL